MKKTKTRPNPMHPCAGGCGAQINDGSHCIGCADMTDPGDGDDGTGLGLAHVDRARKFCAECGSPIQPDGPLNLCTNCAMSTTTTPTEGFTFDADISALVPWYGSNRLLADGVGAAVGDVDVAFVTFSGSLCEIPKIKARQIVCNDKHEDLIRLAKVVRDQETGPRLQSELRSAVFHETELREAQDRIRSARLGGQGLFKAHEYKTDLARARDYFLAAWMGRSSNAGTKDEMSGSLAVRWTGSGGGSVKRFQSAVDALCPDWANAFRRCEFVCQDFRAFHARIIATMNRQREDLDQWKRERQFKAPAVDRVAVYCDPPFPGPGDKYLHAFSDRDHTDLANDAHGLVSLGARVVMRFYDHPLVRKLYPEGQWEWRRQKGGRDQRNEEKPEVLLVAGAAA